MTSQGVDRDFYLDDLEDDRSNLARAVLQLADLEGMPDSFWGTDSRVALARRVLDVPEDDRYSHAEKWEVEQQE